jgi:hypothetical protein
VDDDTVASDAGGSDEPALTVESAATSLLSEGDAATSHSTSMTLAPEQTGATPTATPGRGPTSVTEAADLIEVTGADGQPVKLPKAALEAVAHQHFAAAQAPELAAMRQHYQAVLEKGARLLESEMGPERDWAKVLAEDPIEGPAKYALWQHKKSQLQALEKARAEEGQRIEAEQHQALQKHLQAESARLPELIPEWKDAEVAAREKGDIVGFLQKAGFSAEDINGVRDSRVVAVLAKAARYDRLMAQQPAVTAKITHAPPYLSPGSASAAAKGGDAARRFAKSGTVVDAAALLLMG